LLGFFYQTSALLLGHSAFDAHISINVDSAQAVFSYGPPGSPAAAVISFVLLLKRFRLSHVPTAACHFDEMPNGWHAMLQCTYRTHSKNH
jgi:hypothetical protein